VGATRANVASRSLSAGELPTRPAAPAAATPPATDLLLPIAERSSFSREAISIGFSRMVTQPSRIASTVVEIEAYAVSMTTGAWESLRRTARTTSRPLPSGIERSVQTTSNLGPVPSAARSIATIASATP